MREYITKELFLGALQCSNGEGEREAGRIYSEIKILLHSKKRSNDNHD